jgi:hypothetical protein
MTKIAIVPNAAGTGTFTIEAPNSNSNRTLTLPDAAGELLTDVSGLPAANLTGDVAAARITNALNAGGSAPVYACRAWVNFDGTTTTPTIRASGNVSSVTKIATGIYGVNFATSMPDVNYSILGTIGAAFAAANNIGIIQVLESGITNGANPTTTAVRIRTRRATDNSDQDTVRVNVSIFR